MVTYRVLGSTEVVIGDLSIDLGGRLPRRLLTALLVAGSRPVPDDQLVEAVWGDRAPADPGASLQVYVSRLRQRMRHAGLDVLRRAGSAYRLVPCPGATDVDRFVDDLAEGRALLGDGRPNEALRKLDEALGWWRGEAYADLNDSAAVQVARARLDELRETAVEERLAARLAVGDAAGAVAELDAAVRAMPYRERRWALLILGLYRCGRQADALASLRRVRALLADDLGVDPGSELQRLEQQVLAQDPRLLLPDPIPSAQAPQRWQVVLPLSSFLGRDHDLSVLAQRVASCRLVTLVGPAGAGKTRLAMEYAARRADREGPWLVRLADVTDPRVLASTVAAAVGLTETDGDPRTRLGIALHARDGLLLLDNCEHLAAEVAELVLDLLGRCPGLRVLATSRQPLGVDGEQTLSVGPLSTESAVALVVDRITAIRPGWQPGSEELRQARRLVTALDGIPLALELAAARTRVLGLRELTERLNDHLAVLGAVPRGSLSPHATLEAAIAWSVDLLPAPDRALLWRLWPFEGGFALEAAEAVRLAGSGPDALEALSSLVARSVVMVDTSMATSRYRLLETIRSYCRDHDPQPQTSRVAHAAWVRRLIARSAEDLRGERSAHAMRVLVRELPNLRVGIAHDLRTAPAQALRTVGVLDWFWYRGGRLTEGHRLLTAVLAAAPDAAATDVARVCSAQALLHYLAGDLASARDALGRSVETLGEPHDPEGRCLRGQLHYYQAHLHLALNNPAAAYSAATEAVRIGHELHQGWIVANGYTTAGAALLALGHQTDGQDMLRTAIRQALDCGHLWAAGYTELLLARSMLAASEPTRTVLAVLRRALATLNHEDDYGNALSALYIGALVLAFAGRHEQAARLRAAVHQHALRRGLRPEETDATTTTALNAALGPAPTDMTGEPPTWEATIALLDQPQENHLTARSPSDEPHSTQTNSYPLKLRTH